MKKNHIPSLPNDLIVKILLKLPVRYILRSKCVCKSWHSLISDPEFGQLHFDLGFALSDRLLLKLRVPDNEFMESIDAEASLADSSAIVHHRLPPPLSPLRDGLQFWGSCRGFLLLHNDVHNLIVWNPTTGVHRRIPDSHVSIVIQHLYGFTYDASTDDYLITLIRFMALQKDYPKWQAMINLFSLKSNSWDCNCLDFKGPYEGLEPRPGAFLKGALHWLAYSGEGNEKVFGIIAFDLVERSLSEIPLPLFLTNEPIVCFPNLMIIGGCLSLWCWSKGAGGELWMMKEYNVLSSWTRRFRLCREFIYVTPAYLTKDNVALVNNHLRKRFEKFSCEKGQWLREHLEYGILRSPCNWHNAVYRESLLSLPTHS